MKTSDTKKKVINIESKYKKFFDLDALMKRIEEYLPNFDKKLFKKAFYFAEKAHKGQMRKDQKTPYIVHPVKATEILAELHADQDVLISALLHDVPEDTKHTIAEVKEKFGAKIAFLVEGITKLSKVHYQHDMPKREVESLKKLFLHSAKDLRVILIKLADRLHNMQTLEHVERPEKRLRIAGETLEIYVPIANLLGIHILKEKLEILAFKYLFPLEYEQITKKIEIIDAKYRQNAHIFIRRVKTALEANNLEAKIYQIQPEFYRAYKKITAQGKNINDIKDRISIRLVVDSVAQCYQALGIIHGEFLPKPDRFKDYIATPKMNGYRSLHSVVFGVDGLATNVQIRTKKMDLEDEYGIATHFFEDKEKDQEEVWSKDRRVVWLNKILELKDNKKSENNFLENIKGDILQDRIVTFSPKGKAVDLPKGATAVDFAYAIHSEVGNKAKKASINGKIQALTTILQGGDVVRIVTESTATPKLAWLSFTKTNHAKGAITLHFKRASRKKKLKEGKRLLQKEFDLAGLGLVENINFRAEKKKLETFFQRKFKNLEDLLIFVGEGSVLALSVVKIIRRPISKKNSKEITKSITITLRITAENRPGMLMDISKVLHKYILDMSFVRATTSFDLKYALMKIKVIVKDLDHISTMVNEIEEIDGVRSVYSLTTRGLINFYLLSIVTVLFWALHPFALSYFARNRIADNETISTLIVFCGIILLTVLLIHLNMLIKKYFPLIRDKSGLWIISFIVISAAVGIISSELLYYSFQFDWLVMLIAAVGLYGYWGLSYWSFKKYL